MKVVDLFEKKQIPQNASLDYAIANATDKDDRDSRFEALLPMLENNCSEIIKAYKTGINWRYLLLRGVRKSASVKEFASTILDNRSPGYLNKKIHDIANEVMTEMGLEAHRGNSAFCSTSYETADAWGSNVFIIFPKDGFKFTTFAKVRKDDYLYDELHDFEYGNDYTKRDEMKKMIRKKLEELSPQHTNIEKWLSRSHEYMISGEGYVGLQHRFYINPVEKYLRGN